MSKIFNPIFLKITMIDMDDILRNPHLIQTCRNLSLGEGNITYNSGMNNFLTKYQSEVKHRSIDALGIFAHYLDIPVGWLLFTYEDDQYAFTAKAGEAVVHIYVHHDWRRLGIGAKLLQQAVKLAHPDIVRCYRWSEAKFFEPFIERNQNLQALF